MPTNPVNPAQQKVSEHRSCSHSQVKQDDAVRKEPTGPRRSTRTESVPRKTVQYERKPTSQPQVITKNLEPVTASHPTCRTSAYLNLAAGDNASLSRGTSVKDHDVMRATRPSRPSAAPAKATRDSAVIDITTRKSSQAPTSESEGFSNTEDSLPRRFDGSIVSSLEKRGKKTKSIEERKSIVDDVKLTRQSMLVADGPNGPIPRWSVVGKEPKNKVTQCPQTPDPCRNVQPRTCKRNQSNLDKQNTKSLLSSATEQQHWAPQWPRTSLSQSYDQKQLSQQERKQSEMNSRQRSSTAQQSLAQQSTATQQDRKLTETDLINTRQRSSTAHKSLASETPVRSSVVADRRKSSFSSSERGCMITESQHDLSQPRFSQSVQKQSQAVNRMSSVVENSRENSMSENMRRPSGSSRGCKLPPNFNESEMPPPPATLACPTALDRAQQPRETDVIAELLETRKKSSLIYSGPRASSLDQPESWQVESRRSSSPQAKTSKNDTQKKSKRDKEMESYNDRYGGPHESQQDLQKPKKSGSKFSGFFRRKKKSEFGGEDAVAAKVKKSSGKQKQKSSRQSSLGRRSTVQSGREGEETSLPAPSRQSTDSTSGTPNKRFSLLTGPRDSPEEWLPSVSTNTDSPHATVVTITEKKITRYGSSTADASDDGLESDIEDNRKSKNNKKKSAKKSTDGKKTKKKSK
ncbi:TRIO and F-actin-binding protein-like isoform X2 [Paramacrobiotus metropolitanus]|uniref:TRIO and F-actin-binding protein-like isoform X2 n=1 Tax=Paramacrobiotus metropolitanus TaxID=2943436 RepID=UPI002445D291|nr:TRIO and F-actin-binding protein-like isoform X2 [Paramacrobiotus metropolitanus]